MLYGILVATEHSDRSADPPRRAAMLAAAHAMENLELLSVVAPAGRDRLAPWFGRASGAGLVLWRQAVRRLVHQAARLRQASGVRCTAALGIGGLAAQTLARVDATAPWLVVLGWHAPGWLGRVRNAWAFGALASRSGRPVLVVRHAALRPYARVLVAADFSDAALQAVKVALQCAPGAHFTLLHTLDTGVEGHMRRAGVSDQVIEQLRHRARSAARARFVRFLQELGTPEGRFTLVLTRHPQRAALHVHAAGARPDLIVLNDRQCGILGGLLGMSASWEVLAETSCDLLVIASSRPQCPQRGTGAVPRLCFSQP